VKKMSRYLMGVLPAAVWLPVSAQNGASAVASGVSGNVTLPPGEPTWLVVVIAFIAGVAVGYLVARATGARTNR
jgi:hypothetical protein